MRDLTHEETKFVAGAGHRGRSTCQPTPPDCQPAPACPTGGSSSSSTSYSYSSSTSYSSSSSSSFSYSYVSIGPRYFG